MIFDFMKRNRPVQRFHGRKINSGPIAFLRSRIGVRGPSYFRDSYHGFVIAAVIEKNLIVLLHLAQVISRSVIANASPTGLAIFDKVRPRIGGWFLFHEPKVFHAINVAQASQPVGPAGVLPAELISGRRDARLPQQPRWLCYRCAVDNLRPLFHNRHHASTSIHHL
jgi:hypothetical protein